MEVPATPVEVPSALRAAAWLVSLEAIFEALIIARRDELTPGLRVMLILFLSCKWVFAARVVKLHAGAALGLFLAEGTTALAALGATQATIAVRLGLAAASIVAIVLVATSLSAFPPAPLP